METQNECHPTRDTAPESCSALPRTGQTADLTAGRERRLHPPQLSDVPEPFHIIESIADGRRVIALCGELDLSTAAQLDERLAGHSDVILDLSELSFIDSTGIHVVISTAQRARSEGWDFTVRNPQPAVLRVINLVGLAEHLGVETQTGPEEAAKQPSPLT